jgi:hypothetical protein
MLAGRQDSLGRALRQMKRRTGYVNNQQRHESQAYRAARTRSGRRIVRGRRSGGSGRIGGRGHIA